MNSGNIEQSETIARPDSTDIPIVYSGTPITNRNGEIVGALELITDLTSAKEQEYYLEKSTNKILEEMSKLSKGDLTVHLTPENEKDPFEQLFNGFNSTVKI